MRKRIAAVVLLVVGVLPPAMAKEPGGHYYLQGVREVGSELLLHKDGRFEWFLAYGAADQRARGRWAVRDGRVVLTAEAPAVNASLFQLGRGLAWDTEFEERLRRIEHEAAEERAYARCPFLMYAEAATASAVMGAEPPSEAMRRKAARAALASLPAAGAAAEAAMVAATKAQASAEQSAGSATAKTDAEQAVQAAVEAMATYRGQLDAARDAHREAHMDMPALPELRVPAECGLPAAADEMLETLADADRGLGVMIEDPEVGLRFSGLQVEFEFSDGHREQRITNRGGFALLRPRAGAEWRRVSVRSTKGGPQVSATFKINPARGDLYTITLDSQRAVPPAFEQMSLRIDGEALLPTWPEGEEQGRYVRE